MKRSTAPQAAARRRGLELQCPECTETVRVARDELVEGGVVTCRHCGTEADLIREFDETSGRSRWLLVDPLDEFEEEPPRGAGNS